MSHSLSPHHFLELEKTCTAYRLYTDGDSRIERYGPDLLLSAPSLQRIQSLKHKLSALLNDFDLRPRRVFGRILIQDQESKKAPELLDGPKNLSWETDVLELGLKYRIDFSAGYSIGLFIDQRENRKRVLEWKPASLLNCFSYTCAFSVAAASIGTRTLSIDVAKKALNWGREHFSLNNLDLEGHRFIADDVRKVLPRLARRGDLYECIIMDPPTFGRSQDGSPFRVEEEMPELCSMALDCLAPGGRILLSTNCTRLKTDDLSRIARRCLEEKGIRGRITPGTIPVDFPAEAMPSTLWMETGQG